MRLLRTLRRLLRLSECRICGHYFDVHYDSEDEVALPAACALCEEAAHDASLNDWDSRHAALKVARHRYVAS